jgi:hypothetical protein
MCSKRRPSDIVGGPSLFLVLTISPLLRLDQRCVPQLKRRWAGRCRNISETAQQRFKRRYTIERVSFLEGLS